MQELFTGLKFDLVWDYTLLQFLLFTLRLVQHLMKMIVSLVDGLHGTCF
jgi:hypothetical protein